MLTFVSSGLVVTILVFWANKMDRAFYLALTEPHTSIHLVIPPLGVLVMGALFLFATAWLCVKPYLPESAVIIGW